MKSDIFWDVTSCSSLKVNGRFGGTYFHPLHRHSTCFHSDIILGVFDTDDVGNMFLRNVGLHGDTIDCMFPCMGAYFSRTFVLCVNHRQSPCSPDIWSTYGSILLSFQKGSVQPTIWLHGLSLLCFRNDNGPLTFVSRGLQAIQGKVKTTCILCSVKRSYLHVMRTDKSETWVCVNPIILAPVLRILNR
jgi:hypothetical protein